MHTPSDVAFGQGGRHLSRERSGRTRERYHPAFGSQHDPGLRKRATAFDEFQKRGVDLIGDSVDSICLHVAWVRSIEQTFGVEGPFAVVADLDQKASRTYGMLHELLSVAATVRIVGPIR